MALTVTDEELSFLRTIRKKKGTQDHPLENPMRERGLLTGGGESLVLTQLGLSAYRQAIIDREVALSNPEQTKRRDAEREQAQKGLFALNGGTALALLALLQRLSAGEEQWALGIMQAIVVSSFAIALCVATPMLRYYGSRWNKHEVKFQGRRVGVGVELVARFLPPICLALFIVSIVLAMLPLYMKLYAGGHLPKLESK